MNWYNLGKIPSHLLLDWIHICLDINTAKGNIQTFVGGKNFSLVEGVNLNNPPEKFYLRLGIVDHSYWEANYQFYGKISDISIHQRHNPCNEEMNDSLILWSEMQWNVKGNDVKEINVEDNFCSNFSFINLRVPLRYEKEESQKVCKRFGNGTLLDFDDPSNLSIVNPNLLYGSKWDFDYCECLWTGYKLISKDKVINENTNKTVR